MTAEIPQFTPLSPEEEDKMKPLRGINEEQFKKQAKEQNENRGKLKKTFNIGGVSLEDKAQEEAIRVNELVDSQIRREAITPQVASNQILQSKEFGFKDEATIKAEEFIKSKNPRIIKSIQKGNIASARTAFEKLPEKIKGEYIKGNLREVFEKMISNQVDTLIKSEDLPGIKNFVKKNELFDIGLNNLVSFPREIIQSPDVQNKLTLNIRGCFVNYSPERAVERASEFVALGLMKKEDKENLFASEQYQRDLQARVRGRFDNYSPESALQRANEFVALGLMKKEDKDSLFASEQYQRDLQARVRGCFINTSPERAVERAGEFATLGLMKKEDRNNLFASEQYQRDLQARVNSCFVNVSLESAVKRAAEFVKLGIMRPEKANQIITSLRAKKAGFRSVK